jgi:hypothetical protein
MAETTIAEMLRRFERINLEQLTGEAMTENKDAILDLNREQLAHGKDSAGFDITPPYTPFTVMKKMQKGQDYSVVNLKDTGAFQNRMVLNVKSNSYNIDSTDSKTGKLKEKYGQEILGLSESGKKETWVIVKPDVVRRIKDETGTI